MLFNIVILPAGSVQNKSKNTVLTISLYDIMQPMSDQPEQKPAEEAALDLSEKRVLIIDDDPACLELMKGLLEQLGIGVRTATNGKEAMEMMDTANPDVIVSDVLMPEMDGLEFFKKIKQNEKTSHIPVTIVSQRRNMEDSFIALGADCFLCKPIDAKTFKETVSHLAILTPKPASAEEEKEEEKSPEEEKKE